MEAIISYFCKVTSNELEQLTWVHIIIIPCHDELRCTTRLPNSYSVNLQHSHCEYGFSIGWENIVDPYHDEFRCTTTPSQLVFCHLATSRCGYGFSIRWENIVDPDQLASDEQVGKGIKLIDQRLNWESY